MWYGCETWSLTLREKRRSRVFKNRVLGNILVFAPKRDEVTGEWKKLHNETLTGLYSLPNIVRLIKSKGMRWAWHVARIRKRKGVHRVLVGKSERKTLLGRSRCDGRIILKWFFRKWDGGWTRLICVIIGRSGRLL